MTERHLRLVKDNDPPVSRVDGRAVSAQNGGRLRRALRSVSKQALERMDNAADNMAGPTNGDRRAIESIDSVIRNGRQEMVASDEAALVINMFQRGIAEHVDEQGNRQSLQAILLNGGEVRGIVAYTRSDGQYHYFDGLRILQLPYGNNKYHPSGGFQRAKELAYIPASSIALHTEVPGAFQIDINASGDIAVSDVSGQGTILLDPFILRDLQDPRSKLPFAQDFVNDVLAEWGGNN